MVKGAPAKPSSKTAASAQRKHAPSLADETNGEPQPESASDPNTRALQPPGSVTVVAPPTSSADPPVDAPESDVEPEEEEQEQDSEPGPEDRWPSKFRELKQQGTVSQDDIEKSYDELTEFLWEWWRGLFIAPEMGSNHQDVKDLIKEMLDHWAHVPLHPNNPQIRRGSSQSEKETKYYYQREQGNNRYNNLRPDCQLVPHWRVLVDKGGSAQHRRRDHRNEVVDPLPVLLVEVAERQAWDREQQQDQRPPHMYRGSDPPILLKMVDLFAEPQVRVALVFWVEVLKLNRAQLFAKRLLVYRFDNPKGLNDPIGRPNPPPQPQLLARFNSASAAVAQERRWNDRKRHAEVAPGPVAAPMAASVVEIASTDLGYPAGTPAIVINLLDVWNAIDEQAG
jgi:hypothetical protein